MVSFHTAPFVVANRAVSQFHPAIVVLCKRPTVLRLVPVELQDASVMHGDDELVRTDSDQSVRVLEPKSGRGMRLDGITEPTISCRSLLESIWSERDGMEVVRIVDSEDGQRIVIYAVCKPDTRCSKRRSESDV